MISFFQNNCCYSLLPCNHWVDSGVGAGGRFVPAYLRLFFYNPHPSSFRVQHGTGSRKGAGVFSFLPVRRFGGNFLAVFVFCTRQFFSCFFKVKQCFFEFWAGQFVFIIGLFHFCSFSKNIINKLDCSNPIVMRQKQGFLPC